ncbi:PRC-barrel domain-containing protein [Brevibacillus humidisoli]|uniref:PRC-barrel domain-containing protein n=1 Tax=Brevibacillus humidisoli TaxID=2895522 RepID=UPI001E5A491F|nr:PRC-barrel domain-containing protein [Brevibacillus humidisoli]UFJ38983.1 PRC-barrel domain-containing protein [Brevibacillus humidisoli]
MQRGLDVLGLPVVCLDSGEQIGIVRDILCDKTWRTLGIVLEEKSWFQPGTFIPFELIHAVGDDCLTVSSRGAATSMESLADVDVLGVFTGKGCLRGKTVLTERGESLGNVEDVYFSSNWEKLVGYELSDGWIADLTEGRKRLPLAYSPVVGKEALIIPEFPRHQAESVQS